MSASLSESTVKPQTYALELVPYESKLRNQWNNCVRHSRQPHCFFERDFIEYHGERFHETSLMLKKRGKFLAVLPLAKVAQGFHSYPGLPFGGWITLPQITLSQMASAFDLLADWVVSQNASSLIYNVTPPPYKKHGGDEDLYELDRRGARQLPHKVASLLKIGSVQSVNETVARLARVAVRNGLRVDEHCSLADVYKLACDTLNRRHQSKPLHQLSELEHLSNCFPGLVRVIGVMFNGDLVAGVIFLVHGDIIRMQYIGYSPDCPQGASELLYVHMINDTRHQGCHLDFGTSMNPQTGDLTPSLLGYKERYGARLNLLRSYEWTVVGQEKQVTQ